MEREGERAFLQTYTNDRPHSHPIVSAGEQEWRDYTVEVVLTPRACYSRIGMVFRFHNSRCNYFFGLVEDGVSVIC